MKKLMGGLNYDRALINAQSDPFTELEQTSPIAKMPGSVVAKGKDSSLACAS
jgi:hypothetical protein